MNSEIVNQLRLCDVKTDSFIFITKDFLCDANFIYREILHHYIKDDYSVILLNFAQSYAHYNHVLLKCGINIRQLRENQRFFTIDGMTEIEKLTNLTLLEERRNSAFSALFSDLQNTECLKQLYLEIKTIVSKLNEESKRFVLFIDDISLLLYLGVNLKALNLFVHYCRALCCNQSSCYNVFLVGSSHEKDDSCNNNMVNYLLHLADIKIQVEGLETGYCKDAHGKVCII